MSINNTHSVLFELQKNLEHLSSAKEQVDFFRDKSLEITDGISEVQRKYVEHLQSIKTDYQDRVNELKIELASFLIKAQDENFKAIQKVVDKSEETIGNGIEKFVTVAQKVESSNNEKIEAIESLLENYKNVVEASNSLIETLTAIDFPTKLDALSSKSQLIIESITIAKQALEIKLNESQSSVIEKNNTAKEQIIQSNDIKINSLSEKIVETNNGLKTTLSNNFEEQSKQNKTAFDNINSLFEKQLTQTNERLNKQDQEISALKTLLFVVIATTVIGIIINFVVK
jgi:hypothetical protein